MKIDFSSHTESILKSFLYRIFATCGTIVIAFIFTRNVKISFGIGIFEFISKIILYYVYERLWLIGKSKIRGKNE